jgi:nitric oxide reductase NorE protein
MWLIVGLELLTFSLVFVMVAAFRRGAPALFHAQRAALSPAFGLALTVLLVTSGLFAALAVEAVRARRVARARGFLVATLVAGGLFVALKLHDAVALIRGGHHLGVDDFWDAYFLATGFHFVHVVVGLGLLAWVVRVVARAPVETVAAVALFWHLCDVAWFFLFPLFFAGD